MDRLTSDGAKIRIIFLSTKKKMEKCGNFPNKNDRICIFQAGNMGFKITY